MQSPSAEYRRTRALNARVERAMEAHDVAPDSPYGKLIASERGCRAIRSLGLVLPGFIRDPAYSTANCLQAIAGKDNALQAAELIDARRAVIAWGVHIGRIGLVEILYGRDPARNDYSQYGKDVAQAQRAYMRSLATRGTNEAQAYKFVPLRDTVVTEHLGPSVDTTIVLLHGDMPYRRVYQQLTFTDPGQPHEKFIQDGLTTRRLLEQHNLASRGV